MVGSTLSGSDRALRRCPALFALYVSRVHQFKPSGTAPARDGLVHRAIFCANRILTLHQISLCDSVSVFFIKTGRIQIFLCSEYC